MMHAIFTKNGIPGWIGSAPISGSEPVDTSDMPGDPIMFMAAHRRINGKWVLRRPIKPVAPTAEEVAAEREAEYQSALEARDQACREALAQEADPLFFKWQRGECDRDDWISKVAEVKARFPVPGREKKE